MPKRSRSALGIRASRRVTAAVRIVSDPSPDSRPPALFLCASEDEAELLCARGLDAIDGSKPRDNLFYKQYHGRNVIVTPLGRRAAWGSATMLKANKCDVEALSGDAELAAADLLALPRQGMFDAAAVLVRRRRPLDWAALADRTPPSREWAIDYWLGMRHVTLLSGLGGIGKSLLAQQIGSAIALGVPFIDTISRARNVLLWAAEDDEEELTRRQQSIATSMGRSLADFAGKLIVESFDGRDCTLAAVTHGDFGVTALIEELRQQVNDYRADVAILDNIARLFGGNENDRHQVTRFVAELVGATAERGAAVLLLGHPGRSTGSEFSGSSAWENTVRARLWLSDKLPDQQRDPDTEPAEGVRYLSRRKSNYSARDLRTFHYQAGIFVPEPSEMASAGGGLTDSIRRAKADRVALEAFRKLVAMGQVPTDGSSSSNYLPKAVVEYRINEGLTKRELTEAMRRLMTDGKLKRDVIGVYGNRSPRFGLIEI